MKAKISSVDPTGSIYDTKKFKIPLIKRYKKELFKLEDGSTVESEPMKQNRYIVEIGDYKYWMKRNGKLILICTHTK